MTQTFEEYLENNCLETTKCANCGLDILKHDEIYLTFCLSRLSGFVDVIQKEKLEIGN